MINPSLATRRTAPQYAPPAAGTVSLGGSSRPRSAYVAGPMPPSAPPAGSGGADIMKEILAMSGSGKGKTGADPSRTPPFCGEGGTETGTYAPFGSGSGLLNGALGIGLTGGDDAGLLSGLGSIAVGGSDADLLAGLGDGIETGGLEDGAAGMLGMLPYVL